MFQPLDGPSKQLTISVSTSTVKKIPESGSELSGRQVVTIQPTDGDIYVYFGDGSGTPSATTVSTNGLIQAQSAKDSYEATEKQDIYILGKTGTVNVITIERA